MSIIDKWAYELGYIKEDQFLYKSLPPASRQKLDRRLERLSDPSFLADVNASTKEINLLHQDFHSEVKSFLPGTTNMAGYQAAGSVLRRMYPNPFGLFAFISENYSPVMKARRYCRNEFERDGYVLMADSRVGKREIKKVDQGLRDLGLDKMRGDLFDHIKTFSNFWVVKDKNVFGGTVGMELLLPERLLPLYKQGGDILVGWQYTFGNKTHIFSLDQIDHVKTYSTRSHYIGTPMLAPAVVNIEAALHSNVYNNTLWQKGGLIKAVIALDPMEDMGLNENTFISYAQKLQEIFSRQFSGVRGAGQLMFTPSVRGVHNIISPKDLEGAYSNTNESIAIEACELMGCPPEVLGLARKSQYENKSSVMDFACLAVDNDNYYVASLVDDYINSVIKNDLKVEGVYIKQSGEFGAVSPGAAAFILAIAQSGTNIVTVNQALTRVLHWEPMEGSGGEEFIGHLMNEAKLLSATKPTTAKEAEDMMVKLFGPKRTPKSIKGHEIEFIQYDPKEVKHWR